MSKEKDNLLEQRYQQGYIKGHKKGYDEGYGEGYEEYNNYDEGHSAGYQVGYEEGRMEKAIQFSPSEILQYLEHLRDMCGDGCFNKDIVFRTFEDIFDVKVIL